MKTNAIIRIIVWSIVIIVLVGLLCGFLFGFRVMHNIFLENGTPKLSEDSSGAYVLPSHTELRLTADEIRDLDIEWAAGTIVIQPGNVDEITITESDVSNEKYAMVWKQSGSKLTIQFCKDSTIDFNFGFTINNVLEKDLLITVPQDWECRSLEIDAASATLEVYDLTIREVEIDTASGTCSFENCAVDEIDLDTASGDITFTGTLNTLDCDAASASFTGILSNTPSRMTMDSMSGDLDITLPADAGFTADIDAMSSNFSSDFETSYKNGSHVCGDGRCRISVSAMSGDVIIRKAQ